MKRKVSLTDVKGKYAGNMWLSSCILPPLNTGNTNSRQNLLYKAEGVAGMKLTYNLHV